MRIINAHRRSPRPRFFRAALTIAFALNCGACASSALAQAPHYAFAVISGTMRSPVDEALTQRLIDAIGRERDMSFIVYDGNLKSGKEACRDSLFERRHALLETSRPALIFIPGQHDWADCGTNDAGAFDPVERLDLLRQTLFADSTSMGQTPVALTRESEVSRFRPFRENVRWQVNDTVFVGLNAPGPNNHYLTAGGRNGEFEDRVIANAFWLEHAAEFAKRRDARAVVVFIQGDFDPERYERPDRFAWLRFTRNTKRDGFLEFKRSLVKLAESFHGPVLVIHSDDEHTKGGFAIDQPLRNDKGELVSNLTRIALAPRDRLNQWIQIDAEPGKKPPFRVSVRDVPKQIPLPATPPILTHDQPGASIPGAAAPRAGSGLGSGANADLPPILQTPGQTQPDPFQQDQLPRIPADQGGGGYGPATAGAPATTPATGQGAGPATAASAGSN
jgi:hypothetical protein